MGWRLCLEANKHNAKLLTCIRTHIDTKYSTKRLRIDAVGLGVLLTILRHRQPVDCCGSLNYCDRCAHVAEVPHLNGVVVGTRNNLVGIAAERR